MNKTVEISRDKLTELFGIIEEVKAVETLEYHDKNRLSGNNASRSRDKIDLLSIAINMLSDLF